MKDYRGFSGELRAYQEAPTARKRARVEIRFDELFATVTSYDAWDERSVET